VCYGNWQVTAEPQPQVEQFLFEQPGDLENVIKISSLALSAMDPETNIWGIAHMRLLLNSRSLQPADVRLVLFGDVSVANLAQTRQTFRAEVTSPEPINVRQFPFDDDRGWILSTLYPGDTVLVTGRLEDTSWLRVKTENDIVGWVLATLVTGDGDTDTLMTETPYAPFYSPMQAFLYSSGDTGSCTSAPGDGMLIQTPEGLGRVTFLINEVSIDLISGQTGSTAFVEAEPDGDMAVTMLEGAATVTVGYTNYTAIAGSTVTIPMDPNLAPSGPPNMPEPFDPVLVGGILDLGFETGITAVQPATWDAIYAANNPDIESEAELVSEIPADMPPEDVAEEGKDCPNPPCNECAGQSCDAPGHNK
jgi:hypothetical protein